MSFLKAIGLKRDKSPNLRPGALRRVTAYLRDTSAMVLASRKAVTRDHKEDVRKSWQRAGALAMDIIQNNGLLSGGVDQVLADTIGAELKLQARPDLDGLGYSDEERADFIRLVERRWRQWAGNPMECDLRGKQTIAQMVDAALRYHLVYGESLGLFSYLSRKERRRRKVETGTKVCMTSPINIVQDTNEIEGIYQGVVHDPDGLATHYRLREKNAGVYGKKDYAARDTDGRPTAVHVFDGHPGDVRGIGVFAPALKAALQKDQMIDATVAAKLIQMIFAATLKSDRMDPEMVEGILNLNDLEDDDLKHDLAEAIVGYNSAKYDAAAEQTIDLNTHGRVNVLPGGDSLEFHTPGSVSESYVPIALELVREIARCLGVTAESLSMNHQGATYSSVRMSYSSIWPLVLRRRNRVCAPLLNAIYLNWLDEAIGEGRIPFKGGYAVFAKYRNRIVLATWQGPPKPVADDYKAAKASSERLHNSTSILEDECNESGRDVDEVIERRRVEAAMLKKANLPSPFERNPGAGKPEAGTRKKQDGSEEEQLETELEDAA